MTELSRGRAHRRAELALVGKGGRMNFLIHFLVRSRVGAMIFSGAGVLLFGLLGLHPLDKLLRYPSSPQSITSV